MWKRTKYGNLRSKLYQPCTENLGLKKHLLLMYIIQQDLSFLCTCICFHDKILKWIFKCQKGLYKLWKKNVIQDKSTKCKKRKFGSLCFQAILFVSIEMSTWVWSWLSKEPFMYFYIEHHWEPSTCNLLKISHKHAYL